MKEKMFQVATAFNVNVPAEIVVRGFEDEGSPFVPRVDPDFCFRAEILSDILAWLSGSKTDDGLYLNGPTGCGKSTSLLQVAARLNLPVQRATGHPRLEVEDLLGGLTLIDGDMVWVDGPLTTAVRHGHLFLLDEQDQVDPGQLVGLNTALEGHAITLPRNGGEVVRIHPNFRFAATGNSNGGGDETGLYQGVMRQNLAYMDRFIVVEVGYPDEEIEKDLLAKKAPFIPEILREKMVEVANEVRRLFMSEEGLDVTFSTRTLIRWAYLMGFARGKEDALTRSLDRALANRASSATRGALHEIVQRIFGEGVTI